MVRSLKSFGEELSILLCYKSKELHEQELQELLALDSLNIIPAKPLLNGRR